MITVRTRSAKEAFKGHIDNVEELKQALLKQLPESELWDNLGKRDELHCILPATRGLNPIKSIVGSILANSVLDAEVKVEKAQGSDDDWVYVSITNIKENPTMMQAFEGLSDEDAKKLARIKEEVYYYLGREVSDEEALEVLDFADTKPYTDLSEIVSDYFNQ